jgi:hypothetical protein
MPTTTTSLSQRTSPPVHQHRDWRHLQRAMIAAHRQLADVTQAQFCALVVPAASIAVWILQHAPHLAQRSHLDVLVAQATEYEALDSGRWMQFIPWLVGRPEMRIDVTLVGQSLLPADLAANDASQDAIDLRHRTHSWTAVRNMAPATLHQGSIESWLRAARLAQPERGEHWLPDLCAVFSPTFFLHHEALLHESGLLPLLDQRVPLAFFSTSETEQLVDVYTLEAAGFTLRDRECWPNPWALPTENHERVSVHGKMGWAVEVDAMPSSVVPDASSMRALGAALRYIERGTFDIGPDAILSLGEAMRTAPPNSASVDPDTAGMLLRLPLGVAVDASNGYVYQLQDVSALLLEAVPKVPQSALDAFPGPDDLLRRALWAVSVHRQFVAPFVQLIDDALLSQFTKLDAVVNG